MTDMYAERRRLDRQRMDRPGLDVDGVADTGRGASLAVWAIRGRRDASAAVHRYSKVKAAATKASVIAALLIPFPVAAQAAPPQVAATTAPDPARVIAARRLMDQIMPPATRDQMIRSLMTAMSQTMVGTLRQNIELAATMKKLPGSQAVFDRFIQRQMAAGTSDLIANLPGMLDAMANAYARRFTLTQLNEMAAFFATPTGQAYLAQSPTIMADPDVGAWMNQLMTRSMQRLPEQTATLKAEIEALSKKKSGS